MYRRNLSFSLHRSAWSALVVGVLVSVVLFGWIYHLEQRNENARFERRAQLHTAAVEQGMHNATDAVKVLNQFFVATGNTVTREEFHVFTQPLLERYPYLEGLSFSRVVARAERPAFEERMQSRYPGYRISELVNGRRVVAADKESYRVIDYVEPARRDEVVFGLDGSSVLFMDDPVNQARDTAMPAATSAFPMFNDANRRLGFRIFMPVYKAGLVPEDVDSRRREVAGYTVAVMRADDMFEKILASTSGVTSNEDLKIRMYAAGTADESLLAYSWPNQSAAGGEVAHSSGLLSGPLRSYSSTFSAGGKPWHVVIEAQPPDFLPTHLAALSVLLLGFLLTGGITAYLHFAALRGRQIEAEVAQRTQEIGMLNERLQEDIQARAKVEQALAVSEARARDMADISSDWYWEQDENLRFTHASADVMGKEQTQSTTVSKERMIGATRWELPVDLKASDWDAHRATLEARQPFKDFECRMLLDINHIEWVSVSGKPIFDAEGNFKGYRGTAKNITARKRQEEELRRSRAELRQLTNHMNQVKEGERKRIARDIHDELGQNLLALRIDVSLLDKGLELPTLAKQRTAAILGHIDDTISAVRTIINDLRPSVLDLGLHAALEWEAKEFERRTGIVCTLHIDHEEFELDDTRTTGIFRAVQEALTNIMRHAHASEVEIALLRKGNTLELKIADNGVGVSPESRCKAHSFGLVGIEERIHMMGGTWALTGSAGHGTTILFSVPV